MTLVFEMSKLALHIQKGVSENHPGPLFLEWRLKLQKRVAKKGGTNNCLGLLQEHKLPETNIAPENGPSQRKLIFQSPFSGATLVSGTVLDLDFFSYLVDHVLKDFFETHKKPSDLLTKTHAEFSNAPPKILQQDQQINERSRLSSRNDGGPALSAARKACNLPKSMYLSICLFIYSSIHLFIYLSIYLFIYLSIYLFIYLSIYIIDIYYCSIYLRSIYLDL